MAGAFGDFGVVFVDGDDVELAQGRREQRRRIHVFAVWRPAGCGAQKRMETRNIRQVVDDPTARPTGTIVVDPNRRFLYLVIEDGKAMRYGVGKAGMEFTRTGTIRRKTAWPHWTLMPEMIEREPQTYGGKLRHGMDGGVSNPRGARALYLVEDGRGTLYHINGTNQEWPIGHAVSSGCILMLNQDVIDLHSRVPAGTGDVVLGKDRPGEKLSAASINGDPEL